ncbi:MAG: DUF167 domain-containing protein [Candidatus Thalassarchaeaceae archaeon]|jgi:uncharacterized protein (TIGR00251 family)|nr:DUF167 domain-containing protein [Candidatus Thalassarchaeaceae archaeon]
MGNWPDGILRNDGTGVIIAVDVQPASKRAQIESINIWRKRLEIAVKARAQKGAANEAVCKLISEELGVPPISVTIENGQKSRQKSVKINDITIEEVEQILHHILGDHHEIR